VRNILVVFLLSGLWHGASWTFVAWGAMNALFFLPLLLLGRHRRNLGDAAPGRLLPSLRELAGMLITFGCTLIAWVFFRAETLGEAFEYLRGMARLSLFAPSQKFEPGLLALILLMLGAEWLQRSRQHALEVGHLPAWVRRSIYLGVFLLIFVLGRFAKTEFIYFQF
jgi:D-alanyl-lipoteichoic acid acyltransferase DltB (MBOAT superfamily)